MTKSWSKKDIERLVELRLDGYTWNEISAIFEDKGIDVSANCCRKAFYRNVRDNKKKQQSNSELKFLTIDIETSPMKGYFWGTYDQNIPLEFILEDWSILSFSAKWLHSDEVIYMDTSKEKNVRDDSKLCKELAKLLNEANVILSQNGVRFDVPKINSRLKHHKIPKPTPFQHIDALKINRKHFKDTSNKLDFQTHKFCKLFQKSGHKKYPGNKLWIECLAGNKEAWVEMKDYNQIDVLSLEELYLDTLRHWDDTVQFNVFSDSEDYVCSCGSADLVENGFVFTKTGKFQILTCQDCGKHHQERTNLLTKEKRKSLRK
jgi:hypothetical protein